MKNCGTDLSTYKRYIDRKITNALQFEHFNLRELNVSLSLIFVSLTSLKCWSGLQVFDCEVFVAGLQVFVREVFVTGLQVFGCEVFVAGLQVFVCGVLFPCLTK